MRATFLFLLTGVLINTVVFAAEPIKISCPPVNLISESCKTNDKDKSVSCDYKTTYAGLDWSGRGSSLKGFASKNVSIYSDDKGLAYCSYLKAGQSYGVLYMNMKLKNLQCDAIHKNCQLDDSSCLFTCQPK